MLKCPECGKQFERRSPIQKYCSGACRRRVEARSYYHRNKSCKRLQWAANFKKHRESTKRKLLEIYGSECACCGEDFPDFLTLEHKLRDGTKHREKAGSSLQTWKDAIESVDFDRYEILCMNCNWAKRFSGECKGQEHKKSKVGG